MQFDQFRRRYFITLLGDVAAWPLIAGAQQPERVPRIGVLTGPGEKRTNSAFENPALMTRYIWKYRAIDGRAQNV
jgi:hypothetical protein